MKKKISLWLLCLGSIFSFLLADTIQLMAAGVISENEIEADSYYYVAQGQASSNVSAYNYNWDRYAKPMYSYLQAKTDGGYTRLEIIDETVYVEDYSSDFALEDSKTLTMELPLFGGAFWGAQYNFLVFGQVNPNESDETEVLRVVKYNKSWEKISSCSVYGANTYIPFDAGSLRMTELNGILYIHTCHEMYASDDGYNHQANMTFVLNQSTMKMSQQWYNVMNINYGYVSHSFNQFVATDGTYLYRMDHGDAYPRSVVITKSNVNSITGCSNINLLSIGGDVGDNYTGVEMGGFALMGTHLVSVGNTVSQDEETWSAFSQKNIFVGSVTTELNNETITYLTNYEENADINLGNPHLVKVDDTTAYILWEETVNSSTKIKIAKILADGTLSGEIFDVNARLSDCVPVYASGNLVWYVTSGDVPTFYCLDVTKLDTYNTQVALSDCKVTLEYDTYEFAKQELTPEVTIYNGDYKLQKGVDYTVSYSNNYYPGTATVTITGVGIFIGELTKTFEITAIDISGYRLVLEPSEVVYNGTTQKANSWAVYNGTEKVSLVGTISYYTGARVGNYTYTFTTKEGYGYKGSLTAVFTIKAVEKPAETPTEEVSQEDVSEKVPEELPVGAIETDSTGKASYKVIKSGVAGGMVEYVAPIKQTSTVMIPEMVTVNGVCYNVTSIAKEAFKGNKKLKSVSIGKNVTSIGAKAFYGCKNLKTITIKTTKLTLKKVGAKAFKGIHTKATVKVPKTKLSAYKKIMKKRGTGSKTKYKKLK